MVEKQFKFMCMLARLILHAEILGYQVTGGDLFRDSRATFPYSHIKSLHKMRLAVDLNLFLNGTYLTSKSSFSPLGEFWESMGGTWGGRFVLSGGGSDPGHFSLAHGGMK